MEDARSYHEDRGSPMPPHWQFWTIALYFCAPACRLDPDRAEISITTAKVYVYVLG